MGSGIVDWSAIPRDAAGILSSPRGFFGRMPRRGGYLAPFVFLAAMGLAAGVLQLSLRLLGLTPHVGMDIALASPVVMPVTLSAFGFIEGAILYLLWRVLGSRESYETAYRCAAYLGVLTPIWVVLELFPLLGPATGIVLATFFLVSASVAVHGIPSWKAWVLFGGIGALLVYYWARGGA